MRTVELCFVCGKNENGLSSAYQLLSPGRTAAKLVVSIINESKSSIEKPRPKEIDTDVICSSCIVHLKYIDDCTKKINDTKKIIIELYSLGLQIFSLKRTALRVDNGDKKDVPVLFKKVSQNF